MNGIPVLMHAPHGGKHLAARLMTVAEYHPAEYEIHHIAIDAAHWSRKYLQRRAENFPRARPRHRLLQRAVGEVCSPSQRIWHFVTEVAEEAA